MAFQRYFAVEMKKNEADGAIAGCEFIQELERIINRSNIQIS